MTTTATTTAMVTDVSWDTVTAKLAGKTHYLTWSELREAATQDDADLRTAYAGILAQAEKMARDRRAVRVTVHNFGGHHSDLGARTWGATIRRMNGEHFPASIVAADCGQTGTKGYAMRDAREAIGTLRTRGYDVLDEVR